MRCLRGRPRHRAEDDRPHLDHLPGLRCRRVAQAVLRCRGDVQGIRFLPDGLTGQREEERIEGHQAGEIRLDEFGHPVDTIEFVFEFVVEFVVEFVIEFILEFERTRRLLTCG